MWGVWMYAFCRAVRSKNLITRADQSKRMRKKTALYSEAPCKRIARYVMRLKSSIRPGPPSGGDEGWAGRAAAVQVFLQPWAGRLDGLHIVTGEGQKRVR